MLLSSLCALYIYIGRGWPGAGAGAEGGRLAVRQYFLSSHGQLADLLVRPLLAQHTNDQRHGSVVKGRVWVRVRESLSLGPSTVRSVAYGPPSLGAIARSRRVDSTIAPLLSPGGLIFLVLLRDRHSGQPPKDGWTDDERERETLQGDNRRPMNRRRFDNYGNFSLA